MEFSERALACQSEDPDCNILFISSLISVKEMPSAQSLYFVSWNCCEVLNEGSFAKSVSHTRNIKESISFFMINTIYIGEVTEG
jgi:hypothetical protein